MTRAITKYDRLRRILTIAKRLIGLVLLVLELIKRWQDLSL